MRINDNRPVQNYSNIKKKLQTGSSSETSFSDVLSAVGDSAGATSESPTVTSTNSIDSLLALQEMPQEEIHRNQTVQHGHNLLKSLEALRQSLLLGNVPQSVLQTLESRLKQQREATVDPELHAIMDDIELRAAVELAKFERR